MYDVIHNFLAHNRYTLEDAKWRISWLVAEGRIDKDQAKALRALAAQRAIPEDAPPIGDQVAALQRQLEDMGVAQDVIARAAGVSEAELATEIAAKRDGTREERAVAVEPVEEPGEDVGMDTPERDGRG